MKVLLRRIVLAALCATSVSVVAVADTQAREPAKAALVTDVVPDVVNADLDGATAWVGLKECKALVTNDVDISVRFDTKIDTTKDDNASALFKGAVHYSLARGITSNIECAAADGCVEIPAADITRTAKDITVGLPFRTLTGLVSEAGCETAVDREYFVRISLRNSQLIDTWQIAEGRIMLDTIRPEPPTGIKVVATPNSLKLEWTVSPSTDAYRYVAVVSDTPIAGGEFPDTETPAKKLYPITGGQAGKGSATVNLTSNQVVYVAMATRDRNGNLSALTPSIEAKAADTIDFWDYYQSEGGQEEGGCSVVGVHADSGLVNGGWMMFFSGLALMIGLRRRKQ